MNEEVFSFHLNESLYFEKGQEVAQMLRISLEPEISIQTFNEYVSIRGVIELQGEYEIEQTDTDSEVEADLLDFDDHHSRRYVEEIRNGDNGLATFSHRFPVEISVPTYRVDDTDDIKVNVSSFDYEILDDSQFRLISTIEIHGISNEAVISESERIEHETLEDDQEVIGDQFEFEIKDEQDPLLEELNDEREENSEKPAQKTKEKEDDETDIDKDRWKYKQAQSFEEFFKADDEVETVEVEKVEDDHEATDSDLDVQDETESAQASERHSNYLADLFGKGESGDDVQFEQMRICIVQEQDTLESISERYQVPKLQLLKLNRLSDDDLAKGQLLTIPSKK